jgi:hypothetical protein
MTHRSKNWLVISIFTLTVLGPFAQRVASQEKRPKVPHWISDKGYWVIEGNAADPLNHIVRLYNNDNQLLYKETLMGIKLNPDKRKVKMKLKRALESAVLAWERKKSGDALTEEMAFVKAVFR